MDASVVAVIGACAVVMGWGTVGPVPVVVVGISAAVSVVRVDVVVLMVLKKATVVDGPVAVVNGAIGGCGGWWCRVVSAVGVELGCFKGDWLVVSKPAKLRFDARVHGALPLGVHVSGLLAFPEPHLIVWGGYGALCDYDAVFVWAI